MNNPFITGRQFDNDSFIDREVELKTILTEVSQQGNIVLFGSRRLGKTWLIEKAFYEIEKQKSAIPIFFDIQRYATISSFISDFVTTFYNLAFKSGRIDLFLKKMMPSSSFRASFSMGLMKLDFESNQADNILDTLKEALDIPEKLFKTKPYIIAFDEFQDFAIWDEAIIPIFRSKIQHQKYTSYIFSGSQETTIQKMFLNQNAPFFQSMTHLHLTSYLPIPSCKDYLTRKFYQSGKVITPDGIGEILNQTKGHPLFLNLLARKSWNLTTHTCDQEIVTQTLKEELDNNQYEYEARINLLKNKDQRSILFLLAQQQKDIFSKEVINQLQIQNSNTTRRALLALTTLDFIEKCRPGEYRFTDLFFQKYLQQKGIL